jgi:hypothetical protein
MLEDPATFNRLMLQFIAGVDAQVAGRNRWSGPVP